MDSLNGQFDLSGGDFIPDPPPSEPRPTTLNTVSNRPQQQAIEDSENHELEDETLTERLIGLTEMFPDWFTNGTCKVVNNTASSVKWIYRTSRKVTWILVSTGLIIAAPIAFEMERAQMDEYQKQQQRNILLGPGNLGPPTPQAPMPRV